MTPTSKENLAKIDSMFESCAEKIAYLYGRWQAEKEYEDFNDYIEFVRSLMPEGFTVTGGTKRPFAFNFTIGTDAIYQIKVTARSIGWKRIK